MNTLLNVGYVSTLIDDMVYHYEMGNDGMYTRIKNACLLYLMKIHNQIPNILFGQLIDKEVENRIQQKIIKINEELNDLHNFDK